MSAALDKILSLIVMCIGVYAFWTAARGLRTGEMKHFGILILREEDPKRFFIEIAGRFLAGLLFVGMGLLFVLR